MEHSELSTKIEDFRVKADKARRDLKVAMEAIYHEEKNLVQALIQQAEEGLAAKGIKKGCRVMITNPSHSLVQFGIYNGFQRYWGLNVAPIVMKETKSGAPHKVQEVKKYNNDTELIVVKATSKTISPSIDKAQVRDYRAVFLQKQADFFAY